MIPVNIVFDNIEIKNISYKDINDVFGCINESDQNIKALGRYCDVTLEDIKERYLETLVNSLEFFCGIHINNGIVGIIKGRVENFGNENKVWILTLIIQRAYRSMGIGSKIIRAVEEYFNEKYAIKNIGALVIASNELASRFWIKNGYDLIRTTTWRDNEKGVGLAVYEKRGKHVG